MKQYWAVLAIALLASGCSPQHAAASQDSTTQDTAASPAADSSTGATTSSASGHLRLTGAMALDHDFTVDGCVIGPPGDGLLSGYHMTAKDGDAPIELVAVVVKDYAQDGSYAPTDKTAEGQVSSAMTSGVMGPLNVMVSQGEGKAPLAVMLKPESTMTIQISDNGAKGDAEFTNMETPVTIDDIHPNASTPPHGKQVSGSVTWSCGEVDHIDPKMSGAVNGMFKSLIPPK
jgi:hypothetical protein